MRILMKIKPLHIVTAILFTAFLASIFVQVTSSNVVQETSKYDPLVDLNNDGIIDIFDLVELGQRFGTMGTPINTTETLQLLQRIERIEKILNDTTRVEFVEYSLDNPYGHSYWYGVRGLWNITKLQTDPFAKRVNSTINGALIFCGWGGSNPFSAENKGFEYGPTICASRQLTTLEIDEIRVIIESYLAKL